MDKEDRHPIFNAELQTLLDYLAQQPYADVFRLVGLLQGIASRPLPVAPEESNAVPEESKDTVSEAG